MVIDLCYWARSCEKCDLGNPQLQGWNGPVHQPFRFPLVVTNATLRFFWGTCPRVPRL